METVLRSGRRKEGATLKTWVVAIKGCPFQFPACSLILRVNVLVLNIIKGTFSVQLLAEFQSLRICAFIENVCSPP